MPVAGTAGRARRPVKVRHPTEAGQGDGPDGDPRAQRQQHRRTPTRAPRPAPADRREAVVRLTGPAAGRPAARLRRPNRAPSFSSPQTGVSAPGGRGTTMASRTRSAAADRSAAVPPRCPARPRSWPVPRRGTRHRTASGAPSRPIPQIPGRRRANTRNARPSRTWVSAPLRSAGSTWSSPWCMRDCRATGTAPTPPTSARWAPTASRTARSRAPDSRFCITPAPFARNPRPASAGPVHRHPLTSADHQGRPDMPGHPAAHPR